MPVPIFEECMVPVLEVLSDGTEHRRKDVRIRAVESLDLPESTNVRLTLGTRSQAASRDVEGRGLFYEVDGRLLKESGDVAGARLLWERAAEDGNSDAMNNLGVLLEEAGVLPGAQQWFARAEAAEQQ